MEDMKKIIVGVFLVMALLSQPIQTGAYERQAPKPIEVTYEEAQELMKIAYCEAGNQGVDGQLYVLSVIINRVNSPDYPDNVHDVIYQPYQFATKGMNKAEVTVETHLALCELEKGNLVPFIIAFETADSDSLKKYYTPAFTYKDHTFYTEKH